jgi:hypothetical protein
MTAPDLSKGQRTFCLISYCLFGFFPDVVGNRLEAGLQKTPCEDYEARAAGSAVPVPSEHRLTWAAKPSVIEVLQFSRIMINTGCSDESSATTGACDTACSRPKSGLRKPLELQGMLRWSRKWGKGACPIPNEGVRKRTMFCCAGIFQTQHATKACVEFVTEGRMLG